MCQPLNGNESQLEPRSSVRTVFRRSVFIYFAVLLVLIIVSTLSRKVWLLASLLLGSIFVVIVMTHFHENIIIPYLHEKSRLLPATPSTRNWVSEWLLPAVIVQLFVVLGFLIAIGIQPFNSTMYSNATLYGTLYKKWHELPEGTKSTQLKSYVNHLNMERIRENGDPAKSLAFIKSVINHFGKNNNNSKPGLTEKPDRVLSLEKVDQIMHTIPFFIAFSFGFLGALIYCLKDIVYRSFTEDLYSSTLTSYIIRLIVAPVLSVVFAHFQANNWFTNYGPLIFFCIGFFPQRAMDYMEEKMSSFLNIKSEKVKEELPLNLIQGMNDYIISRFQEIGITDVQNLACVNLHDICRKIGYSRRMLCDFVSQAILLVHLREHRTILKSYGVRDLFSFQAIINDRSLERFAESTKIDPEILRGFLEILKSEGMKQRIANIRSFLYGCNKIEQNRMEQENGFAKAA